MIDTFSLLLSHILLFVLVVKIVMNPDINAEPDISGRHFKVVGPKATREQEARDQLRAEQAAKAKAQAEAIAEARRGR